MSLMTKIQEALAANPGVSWNDLVLRRLRTATSSTDGALNDLWMRWLASQGYTLGGLQDRMMAYWRANNTPMAERNAFYLGYSVFFSTPPAPTDPNFASVSTLLSFDGTNGSTTFTDTAGSPLTWTASGNAQLSTTDPKFGSACLLLDGAGDYISSAFSLATSGFPGDFTVEAWVRPAATGGTSFRQIYGTGINAGGLVFGLNNGIPYFGRYGVAVDVNGTSVLSTTEYTHVAVSRSGTSVRLFVNGVQEGSTFTNGVAYPNAPSAIFIGSENGTDQFFNGRIDEYRITRGVARYTANFTPPTVAFPTN